MVCVTPTVAAASTSVSEAEVGVADEAGERDPRPSEPTSHEDPPTLTSAGTARIRMRLVRNNSRRKNMENNSNVAIVTMVAIIIIVIIIIILL